MAFHHRALPNRTQPLSSSFLIKGSRMTYSPGPFLAIDQSTSATKGLLFSPDGGLLDQEALSTHKSTRVRAVWSMTPKRFTAIRSKRLPPCCNVTQNSGTICWRLSITNQRETFVIFDRESGQPLYNAIVWQCRRGDDFCKRWPLAGYEEVVHELNWIENRHILPSQQATLAVGCPARFTRQARRTVRLCLAQSIHI